MLIQNPGPGTRMIRFCGDLLTFSLTLPQSLPGTAWVRTNIGHAGIIRNEIIREVDKNETPLGRAWFDIPMKQIDERRFEATLPLFEVGHFEAKCFFLKEGEVQPSWPPGENTAVNVESADACCANIIYNAFVRQFGPNKTGGRRLAPSDEKTVRMLDREGYAVIPPSGRFRDLIAELDFIIGELGCCILMLLPIHPTPTTYGRMGRFGSPYAALSFTAVDPALAQFDPHATPLEQFIELVDAVHQRNAKIFIDIAINHTGWAARLHETRPHWLVRSPEGRIEVPGAWGVAWEDLTKLDYSRKDLWQYMADVFLTWCRRGVDGFRCDAGYMIPAAAWKYMIARVRTQFPDAVFLLEGLGGKISVTRDLLNSANLNWAYSELFQNYDRAQIEHYLPQAVDISGADGITVHFAETHDNPRLAARSETYARMRTALCALSSHNGAFGFANGVEWYAAEKINVHDAPSLNWGAESNQVAEIRRLADLLKGHPAFHEDALLSMHQQNEGNFMVLKRKPPGTEEGLLIIVNLDAENRTKAAWDPVTTELEASRFYDLISGNEISAARSNGLHTLLLEPGQVLCLSTRFEDLEQVQNPAAQPFRLPDRIEQQRLYAKAIEVVSYHRGIGHLDNFDRRQAARQLQENPVEFCRKQNTAEGQPRVIVWQWPQDLRREVMIPPDHFLLVRCNSAFRARIVAGDRTLAAEVSLPGAGENGSHFALFLPPATPRTLKTCSLSLSVYGGADSADCRHETARLLLLSRPETVRVRQTVRHAELRHNDFIFLATNGRGAMLHSPVAWGNLTSRYDGLLAANLNPDYPEDRRVMLSRCRVWVVFQGYSQSLNTDCLEMFRLDADSSGIWRYHIPTGQGEHVLITVRAEMIRERNSVALRFFRHPADHKPDRMADDKPVTIILRPDVENRNFHASTKAYQGPENDWPHAVRAFPDGFHFAPDAEHQLRVQIPNGSFVVEPEWHYMVKRPEDARRGHDPDSDLFSPGYLSTAIHGNQTVTLIADAGAGEEIMQREFPLPDFTTPAESEEEGTETISTALQASLAHYVVRRGNFKTVIAGYPWFLDWGRDALIFVRGLAAAGKTADAKDILIQFARYEENGTLPNMIQGRNAANRDTSDAPLWLITACADLIQAEDDQHFLESDCAGRSLRQILLSIGRSLKIGSPNGVRMDPESGLIYSPSHFTWMDTDHPAGTPRQGYPIEIQALWHAGLSFLSKIDSAETKTWLELARLVQDSIRVYFWLPDLGYLSDCLHAAPGEAAKDATADDALRPNQLLAITLGALGEPERCESILENCQELLVPGGIRSLADRPVRYEIPIHHHGKLINDPRNPYQGRYEGDEDTRRKPAYHNGTAWTWMFPSFCEAWVMTFGKKSKDAALAWLSSSVRLLEHGCLGHIPEILDGDFPHTQRGCDAQAWGASELLRVWLQLTK